MTENRVYNKKSPRFNRKILLGIILIVIVAGASAWVVTSGVLNPKTQDTTVRIVIWSTDASTVELAQQLGYYDEVGLKIDVVAKDLGGPDQIIGVAAGSYDFGTTHFTALINAVAGGAKVKAVVAGWGSGTTYQDPTWFALNNSGIRPGVASDLIGKRIGINTLGAESEYVTKALLAKYNITSSQVTFVVIPVANLGESLLTGAVDVVVTSQPTDDYLLAHGAVALFNWYEVSGRESANGAWIASNSFIAAHPDIVEKFVTATAKAGDWSRTQSQSTVDATLKTLLENKGAYVPTPPRSALYFVPQHSLISDSDVNFWINSLADDGKIAAGAVTASDIYTNQYNSYK
jgi:ABC-type nitrate/sulfonate/bicarbonate transport system substrate-binding protein